MILVGGLLLAAATASAEPARGGPLDPRGRIHLPIGIPNTLDTLKTFVEAEGNFSPGFGSYGVYFWLWDPQAGKLTAPTMDHVEREMLLRDCLVLEDGDRLRLLSGVPPEWFTHPAGMAIEDLRTHFGKCSLVYRPSGNRATLTLSGQASPPGGFLLALPGSLQAKVAADGKEVVRSENGDCLLPSKTRQVQIELTE